MKPGHPTTNQELYDFLSFKDFYEGETNEEYATRRDLFFKIEAELDEIDAMQAGLFDKQFLSASSDPLYRKAK